MCVILFNMYIRWKKQQQQQYQQTNNNDKNKNNKRFFRAVSNRVRQCRRVGGYGRLSREGV